MRSRGPPGLEGVGAEQCLEGARGLAAIKRLRPDPVEDVAGAEQGRAARLPGDSIRAVFQKAGVVHGALSV